MNGLGDADVLAFVTRPDPEPGPGMVLVQVAVAGVNFMDLGVRQGMSWNAMPNPKILGVEGAGRVLALGDGVDEFEVGQRVAWVYAPGSYAQRIALPAASLVPLPDAIDDRTAAAVMMQGLTASHFATDFHPMRAGDIAFVHAAAGGLGLLLTQIIKLRGGEGVHVVYDGSGPATFQGSLDVLRRCGTFCWYGPVLGGPGAIDIMRLPRSIKLGYAVFSDHIATPALLRAHAARLFGWIAEGALKVHVGGVYPLADAARAHTDMASRATTGKLLLIP